MTEFQNQATLSFVGGSIASNIVNGELTSVITATKTAVTDRYTQYDDVTYHLFIANSGTSDYNDITVTDNLGAYFQGTDRRVPLSYVMSYAHLYRNGVEQAPPTTETRDTTVIFSDLTVPADGNIMIAYEVKINEYAPLASRSTITNKAVISGGGLFEPIEVTETITVEDYIRLNISKAICPAVVVENGTLTYTFHISNSGNRDVIDTDQVAIQDTFTPILSGVTVKIGTRQAVLGTDYNYNTTTGLFYTIPGNITVPAATFTQGTNGVFYVDPGDTVVTVTGIV